MNKGNVNKNQRIFVENNSSKLGTPKSKARRTGVFDMQTFLNTGPMRQSKSILLESEQEQEQDSEISEELETESNPKVYKFFLFF